MTELDKSLSVLGSDCRTGKATCLTACYYKGIFGTGRMSVMELNGTQDTKDCCADDRIGKDQVGGQELLPAGV